MANFNSTYLGASELNLFAQSPSEAMYIAPSSVTVSANFRYYQRVYSSGLGVWCYYSTVNAPNANPDPSTTSPNWTGTISDAQVVATALIAQ